MTCTLVRRPFRRSSKRLVRTVAVGCGVGPTPPPGSFLPCAAQVVVMAWPRSRLQLNVPWASRGQCTRRHGTVCVFWPRVAAIARRMWAGGFGGHVGGEGLAPALPTRGACKCRHARGHACGHACLCSMQVWPATNATREFATRYKARKKDSDVQDYVPYVYADLRKCVATVGRSTRNGPRVSGGRFLAPCFPDFAPTHLEDGGEKPPKAAMRYLDLATWAAAWDRRALLPPPKWLRPCVW